MREKLKKSMLAGMNLQYRWYSLDYFLDAMAELGFESIALWGGPPHFYCDHLHYSDCTGIGREICNRGLHLTGFLVTASQYRYQPAYEEPEQIERSYRYFENGLHACAELGCKCMTICSGYGYFDHDQEEAFQRATDMMWRLSEAAQSYGVLLAIESLKASETQICVKLEDVKRMHQAVNHSNFKVIADTGALADNQETLDEWFTAFGDELIGMHFVDRDHLVWGEGGLPLEEMIRTIYAHHFTGPLMLETSVRKYMGNPKEADRRALRVLEKYFEPYFFTEDL